MAEDKGSAFSKLDLGITNTKEISSDDLFDQMEHITGDPNKVKKLDKDDKDKDNKDDIEDKTEGENPDILNVLDDEPADKTKSKETIDGKVSDDKKDKTDEKGKEGDNDDDSEDKGYFGDLSKELFKLGVFTKDDDEDEPEIKTPEEFLELFVNEKKKGAIEILESILSQHGEDKRELFDAVILKGMDPKSYLEKYNILEDLRAVDMTDESNQERVMREELKSQGWDKADIDTEVDKIKSYGDLESASKRYHKSLIKRTEAQLTAEKQRKDAEAEAEAERDVEYRTNITAILNSKLKEKEFDGIPVTQQLAQKVMDSIYTKKWRLPNGETITDFDNEILRLKRPENHALKVKLGLIMELLKTDPTLSSIKKKAVSGESNSLFADLEKKKKSTQSSQTNKKSETSLSSWFSQ